MTLYYTMVFVLLMVEMVMFMLLVLPIPSTIKRTFFTFISENPIVAKIQYWMKIIFVFILILFIDSVNRVYRVQVELKAASEAGKIGAAHVMGHERLEVQARKFYSERNMYLCGFTLFLSLILNRTYVMILEVMRIEDKLRAHEDTNQNAAQAERLAMAGNTVEIARLRKELESKDVNLKTLKKQCEGLQREYNDIGDKYAETMDMAGSKKDK